MDPEVAKASTCSLQFKQKVESTGRKAPEYMDFIMNYLDQGELPGIKANLNSFTLTHVTSKEHCGLRMALLLVLNRLRQSAHFRFHNKSRRWWPLFLWCDTHPGAGLPGVLCSAKVLDRVLPEPAQRGYPSSKPHYSSGPAIGMTQESLATASRDVLAPTLAHFGGVRGFCQWNP